MGGWGSDLRYAIRMIRRQPGTSAMAVVALALGIGLTTVMFSIVQGVILRGLPFEDADRIQHLTLASPANPRGRSASLHDFIDWRARQQSFESLEAYTAFTMTVTGAHGFPEQVRGARITPGTLRALRTTPLLGRDLTDADAVPGAPAVILIGHQLWQSQFQLRPDAIGQTVRVNGVPTEVIGVMGPRFGFPNSQHAWMPLTISPPETRGAGTFVSVIGRLRPGATEQQAMAELAGISAQLAAEHPENTDTRAAVAPFVRTTIGNEVVSILFTMLGAVFGVLLIACVNVTNLQLARAAARTRETAVRVAIGASRWRIVRQLVVEGLLLSIAGAVVGLALAWAGTTMFSRAIVDTNPPFWIDVRLDPVVLLFATAITVTAALVSSLVPGWRLAGTDVNGSLKDEGRGSTSLRMGRFTRGLVAVEVAVSCVLLVVSGLMVRSIVESSRFTVPFATRDVFVGGVPLDSRVFPERADVDRALARITEDVRGIPGVRAVAFGSGTPRAGMGGPLQIEGQTYASPDARPRAGSLFASTQYFDVLRVKPLLGRVFTDSDIEGSQPVAVVDESFAQRHFPEGALGRRIRFEPDGATGSSAPPAPWLTIVGVVPTLAEAGASNQPTEMVFRPTAQTTARFLTLFASTSGDPMAIAGDVRCVLAGVGEGVPVTNPASLAAQLWQDGWPVRVFGGLFMAFGVAALFLAAAGLYGVMAFGVRQRTQEIGVRMAMGAARGAVLRMILWQGGWRVGLATAVGLLPGWQVGRLMGALLRNVSPGDPLVLSLTAGTMLMTGVAACLAPALRAASIDPIVALRGD